LTSSYVLLVLAHALAPADEPVRLRIPVSRVGEVAALALALCSLLLGLVHWDAYLPVSPGALLNPLILEPFAKMLWPLLGGAVLAILLGRWGGRLARLSFGKFLVAVIGPARRTALALSGTVERVDGVLRQWPAAGLSLLVLAILFGAALLVDR
jgi:hypothetical protein